jgi:hypothetical protein
MNKQMNKYLVVRQQPVFCFTTILYDFTRNLITVLFRRALMFAVMLWIRPPRCLPFPPQAKPSLLSCLIAFVLITVELNVKSRCVRFGSLNAGGATSKCALIAADMIRDNRLDVLVVFKSWVATGAPDAIKYNFAPPDYSVLHDHRPMNSGRRRRGGGLGLIYSNNLSVRPLKILLSPNLNYRQ